MGSFFRVRRIGLSCCLPPRPQLRLPLLIPQPQLPARGPIAWRSPMLVCSHMETRKGTPFEPTHSASAAAQMTAIGQPIARLPSPHDMATSFKSTRTGTASFGLVRTPPSASRTILLGNANLREVAMPSTFALCVEGTTPRSVALGCTRS